MKMNADDLADFYYQEKNLSQRKRQKIMEHLQHIIDDKEKLFSAAQSILC